MRIAIIGGGPAWLYFAISAKLRDPAHGITAHEHNRADDTFGWGAVLSKETLQNLAANDPISAGAIRADFASWDDVAVMEGAPRRSILCRSPGALPTSRTIPRDKRRSAVPIAR